VAENDSVKLNGKDIAVDQLEEAVRNLSAEQRSSLALRADKKASFGTIIKVLDALKLAGIKNLPAFTQTTK
jgi:biopolymer transport protein ExbD